MMTVEVFFIHVACRRCFAPPLKYLAPSARRTQVPARDLVPVDERSLDEVKT